MSPLPSPFWAVSGQWQGLPEAGALPEGRRGRGGGAGPRPGSCILIRPTCQYQMSPSCHLGSG